MERVSSEDRWLVLFGAIAGAVAAYLVGTPRGRQLCNRAVHLLDEFSFDCVRLCDASMQARSAVVYTWRAIEHAPLDNTSLGGMR